MAAAVPASARPRRSRVIAALATLAALAAAPSLAPSVFYLHLANLIFLNLIFVVSLGMILRTGQLSLCHAAFAGVGAYASALLAMSWKLWPLMGVALGALAAGALAFIIGAVILRLRGVYFVLVTFLFGQVFNLLVLDAAEITRGANGLVGIPSIRILGVNFGSPFNFYYLALGAAALVLLLAWALLRSPTGRAFDSVEENRVLAEASGVDTHRVQLFAFVLGSAIAGLGGGLMAHYVRFISPDTFTFWESVAYIMMLVVGGRASLGGWVLGVVFLTPLPELLRGAKALQHVLYGGVLIAVLLFMPGGLVTARAALAGLARRVRGAAP